MQEEELLSQTQVAEIKDFLKKNSYLIYQYINTHILQDIGKMDYNYFLKSIEEIFSKDMKIKVKEFNENLNILPYFLFTRIAGKGKIDYTSLRMETIDLKQINKESMVYYNYAQFFLQDDFLYLELRQTKMGGMPIDKDIVKFAKKIPVKTSGLEDFINLNK